jgi:hypothetical protein
VLGFCTLSSLRNSLVWIARGGGAEVGGGGASAAPVGVVEGGVPVGVLWQESGRFYCMGRDGDPICRALGAALFCPSERGPVDAFVRGLVA